MDNNSTVDNTSGMSYNTDNDINEIVVKMDEQVPIHDTECKHTNLVLDPTDTIGDAVYHGCDNLQCGYGFYIRPT